MKKTNFTPGPWEGDSFGWIGSNGERVIISEGPAFGSRSSFPQAEPNSHLVKAAPELYEALASIENDDGRIPETIWKMRNDALKKARGDT